MSKTRFERMMRADKLPAWWKYLTYAHQTEWPDYEADPDDPASNEGVMESVAAWAKEHPSQLVDHPVDANLALSKTKYGDDQHMPVIDLDHDAALIRSSTFGNHHLYINHRMTWKQYKKLLKVMVEVGLVQEGFYQASKARGHSAVRLPWIEKGRENE